MKIEFLTACISFAQDHILPNVNENKVIGITWFKG